MPEMTNGQPVRGPYMHSANGRKIYPFDPQASEVNIDVVAHHLACNGRWNGATQHKQFRSRIYFSVAEHSVLVARYLREEMNRPDLELEGLLHDAPEYLLSDMIRPIKHDPRVHPVYKPLEDKAEYAIAGRFNLVFPLPKEIKIADDAVCAAEARQIVPKSELETWESKDLLHDDTLVAPYEIEMMNPFEAKMFFLDAYEEAIARRSKYASLPFVAKL
ncbi:HD domain-containing protein [Pararhizobium qamdonense]|uniref:hypothetical protein n=1 Tax=Pararhizobium qamdonense TaxID=3031126 RepID=UPI0023E20C5B|nr:hypothetical protein [Pararhizobium qamdonense]